MAGSDLFVGRMLIVLAAMIPVYAGFQNRAAAEPVKIIFDTDIGNDIDDALALSLIHHLQDRGEAELLAVTVCKDNPWAAAFVDVINTFHGRPGIPIGVVRAGKTPEDGAFNRQVADRRDASGGLVYPHDLTSGIDAPEAVGLLRRTLAGAEDRSIILISVGFMTNMARLLDSGGDDVSPLPGMELVKAKVRLYSAMAGAFAPPFNPEYNIFIDHESSRIVLERWPTEIVFSGFEIGLAITYPAASIDHDFRWTAHHPVAEAYRLYQKMPYDRPTWDLTAVLYAVRPDRGYFGLSNPGYARLGERNTTPFTEDASGKARHLTVTSEQAARVREAFTHLVSAPPRK